MNLPEIVSPEEWETANKRILAKEKAVTHLLHELARYRGDWTGVELSRSLASRSPGNLGRLARGVPPDGSV